MPKFKHGDTVFVVERVSKYTAHVEEGVVIACDPEGDETARVSWHDKTGLCFTSSLGQCFGTKDEAVVAYEKVLSQPWEPNRRHNL